MFSKAMLYFLSEDNIKSHLGYMANLKHKYSIIEKSYPKNDHQKASKPIMPRGEYRTARLLLDEFYSHKIYFDSFADNTSPCYDIRKYYSSEDAFCFEVMEKAKRTRADFLFIVREKGRAPYFVESIIFSERFLKEKNILALDLSEHAYFLDYRFDRDRYIRVAVARLNIQKLFYDDKKDLT